MEGISADHSDHDEGEEVHELFSPGHIPDHAVASWPERTEGGWVQDQQQLQPILCEEVP